MKVYVVTQCFMDPRYERIHGSYLGVFPTEDDARAFINETLKPEKNWLDAVLTGEFTTENGITYLEGNYRKKNKYFNYAIREEDI